MEGASAPRHRRCLSDTAVLYGNLKLEDVGALGAPDLLVPMGSGPPGVPVGISQHHGMVELPPGALAVGPMPLTFAFNGAAPGLGPAGATDALKADMAGGGGVDQQQQQQALFSHMMVPQQQQQHQQQAGIHQQQQQQAEAAGGGRPVRARKPTDKAASLGVIAGTGKRTAGGAKGSKDPAATAAVAAVAAAGQQDRGASDPPNGAGHQRRASFAPALPSVLERDDGGALGAAPDLDFADDDSDDSGGGSRARGGGAGRSRAELLSLDPKRAKRILANRLSAARSKERRVRYTMELEARVRTLDEEVARLAGEVEAAGARAAAAAAARADADGRVAGLRQLMAHVQLANQALAAELLALQRGLGLPERLPCAPAVLADAAAAAAAPSPSASPSQQQQQQQQQAVVGGGQRPSVSPTLPPPQQAPAPRPPQQPQAHPPVGGLAGPQSLGMRADDDDDGDAELVVEEDGDVEMLAELLGVTGSPIRNSRDSDADARAAAAHAAARTPPGWGPGGAGAAPGAAGLRTPLLATLSDPVAARNAFSEDGGGAPTLLSWPGGTPSDPAARVSDGSSFPATFPGNPLLPQPLPQPAAGAGLSQPLPAVMGLGGGRAGPAGAPPHPGLRPMPHHQRSASAGSLPPSLLDPSFLFAPGGFGVPVVPVGAAAASAVPAAPGGAPGPGGASGSPGFGRQYLVTTPGPGAGGLGGGGGGGGLVPQVPGAGAPPVQAPFRG